MGSTDWTDDLHAQTVDYLHAHTTMYHVVVLAELIGHPSLAHRVYGAKRETLSSIVYATAPAALLGAWETIRKLQGYH